MGDIAPILDERRPMHLGVRYADFANRNSDRSECRICSDRCARYRSAWLVIWARGHSLVSGRASLGWGRTGLARCSRDTRGCWTHERDGCFGLWQLGRPDDNSRHRTKSPHGWQPLGFGCSASGLLAGEVTRVAGVPFCT